MKLLIFNEDWADEHNVPALEVMTDEEYNIWCKKPSENLCAYLGNSGDGFEENFTNYYLYEEFVKANIVKVTEITEDFYNTFKAAKLSYLSLCNIFEL